MCDTDRVTPGRCYSGTYQMPGRNAFTVGTVSVADESEADGRLRDLMRRCLPDVGLGGLTLKRLHRDRAVMLVEAYGEAE